MAKKRVTVKAPKKTKATKSVAIKSFPEPDTIIEMLASIGVTQFAGVFSSELNPEWVTVAANVSPRELLRLSQHAYSAYEDLTNSGAKQ